MTAQGQNTSQIFKQAKHTKAEYGHYQMKLKNARDKLKEAQENASKDNDKEKAKKVAKIKKLVESSIGMSETAADIGLRRVRIPCNCTACKDHQG
jgi:hypothetical protein